ncbi:MAG: hypothetical protein WC569_04575 [Candidatus Omnitrophota bacterium]
MKKIVVLIMALSIIIIYPVFSAQNANDLAAIEKAKLNNIEWTVDMRPASGKGRAETDIISFVEGKMMSKNMKDAGFLESEVNVRISEDDVVIWETMQTDTDGNFVFWRGDIENGRMKGMMAKEDKRGNITNFSFISK